MKQNPFNCLLFGSMEASRPKAHNAFLRRGWGLEGGKGVIGIWDMEIAARPLEFPG